ncbi:MAG: DUF262 domain-containing protein [Alphaproteobacteria bacterium]
MSTTFKTETNSLRKLLGNGLTYSIPRFQRDYSWSEVEWEDLWADIIDTIREGGEPAHYMGYLVLKSQNEKTFDVIDGQQRLTTLSIVVLATLRSLKKLIAAGKDSERNQQRLEQLRQTYIGYLDPVTLVPRSKITLNRNNDHYYQTYLVPLEKLPQRGFRASEHLLRKASDWFEKKVDDYIKNTPANDAGIKLASLIDVMSDRLFFTVITVTDELNAYKVFETLNARGVRLSATDLLKNYLFSIVHSSDEHEHEMKKLEDRWESLVSRLQEENFPDFLRMHWISRNNLVRQSELFKIIRNKVKTREEAFALLRGLDEDMDTYLGLIKPDLSSWPKDTKYNANLLRMFGVRLPFPVLMAAKRILNDTDFECLMRVFAHLSFRYNVICSLQTNEQERVYSSLSSKISSGHITTLSQILDGLKTLYVNDDDFKAAFEEKMFRTTQSRNKKIVKYILCELEYQRSGNKPEPEDNAFNIEHVLPENPSDSDWSEFTDEEFEAYVYRIGNMTVLSASKNREIQNYDYVQKRPIFQDSQIQITKDLADAAIWNPAAIGTRQRKLAQVATGIWKVSQLS